MFNLRFSSETNNPALLVASTEYQSIWKKDGQKIKEIMEKISGLSFPKKEIPVIIFEGMSTSGSGDSPMKLRGSYSLQVKEGTLIHELGHRLIEQLKTRPADLDEHDILFLILYETWTDIYGQDFADEMVQVEKDRKGHYDYASAWNRTLALSKPERRDKFSLVKKFCQ
jgi:hypothetical protein